MIFFKGVHVYWTTSSFLSLIQFILLKKTPLQKVFGIPKVPPQVNTISPFQSTHMPALKPSIFASKKAALEQRNKDSNLTPK
jgi:membrane protein insertase Oxa1/YidC/SpoIIIJ